MTKRVTVKPLMFIEECRNGIFEYNGERLTNNEIVNLIDAQYEEIQQLKIKIEDTELELENTKEHNDTAHYELYQVKKENERLKSENNMLKVTIGRNEAYIKRLIETSKWHC